MAHICEAQHPAGFDITRALAMPDNLQVEDDPALPEKLRDPSYGGVPERAIVFHLDAWDVNCPQHIIRRYTEDDVAAAVNKMQARIQELEAEVGRLKGEAGR